MSITELKDQVMRLSVKERAELARDLLQSLEQLSEEETDALWLEEAERRLEEVKQGKMRIVPGEEVRRRAGGQIP